MTFEKIKRRLEYLEIWREIAVRPSFDDCHVDDEDLLSNETDNLTQLSERCLAVRGLLNDNLPPHDLALDNLLQVKDSTIPNAGKGLFFYRIISSTPSITNSTSGNIIPCNTVICYYTGHVHNNFSQKYLVVDRSYLMNVAGDLFVDPGPLLSIKARYINDPLNANATNCKFVPEPDHRRCSVVATRDIQLGEEIFVSYGDFYWSQQPSRGTIYTPHKDKLINSPKRL